MKLTYIPKENIIIRRKEKKLPPENGKPSTLFKKLIIPVSVDDVVNDRKDTDKVLETIMYLIFDELSGPEKEEAWEKREDQEEKETSNVTLFETHKVYCYDDGSEVTEYIGLTKSEVTELEKSCTIICNGDDNEMKVYEVSLDALFEKVQTN